MRRLLDQLQVQQHGNLWDLSQTRNLIARSVEIAGMASMAGQLNEFCARIPVTCYFLQEYSTVLFLFLFLYIQLHTHLRPSKGAMMNPARFMRSPS